MIVHICFLLLFIQDYTACQAGPNSRHEFPHMVDFSQEDDWLEYNALLQACKTIKQLQCTIGDVRLHLQDCIATSITLYLMRVDTHASRVLLQELKRRKFQI
jgi:hypothetical protein